MKLYLARHGKAVTEMENPQRPLSEEGHEEVKRVAKFLLGIPVMIDSIWHSPKARSKQTAEHVAQTLKLGNVCQEINGIQPGDSIECVLGKVDEFSIEKPNGKLMIVGHLPSIQKLTDFLLTGSDTKDLFEFFPATVVALQKTGEKSWRCDWVINPEMLLS